MIGPSSGADGVPEQNLSENLTRAGKKRILDDLDIEKYCEEIQNSRKRCPYQEIDAPIEIISSNQLAGDTATLFSPLSAEEAVEECPVARLEVLLVDGTNCTWTTLSELQSQQTAVEMAGPSFTSSSSSENKPEQVIHEMQGKESSYTIDSEYWESVVTVASNNTQQNKLNVFCNNQQQEQEQQQYDDQETGNLSWLLDFKLDPFIEAADDKSTISSPRDIHNGNRIKVNGRSYGSAFMNGSSHKETNQILPNTDNRNFTSARCKGPKKPPFTYTELIEHALRERGELTVSAIYQWISEHFPYYKSNDDRWKNSVRHNLSINPHFRKGSKAPHGAGHLWAIANRCGEPRPRQTVNTSAINSSIKQVTKNFVAPVKNISQMNPIDEVEAATASITEQSSDDAENFVNSVTLEHCAEEILSGIKKEVEVQYLVPMMVSSNENESDQSTQQAQEIHYPVKESDFLNPVSKEVVAEECGLISEGYLVTDLNTTTLGLNMIEPEIIAPENLFGEELSFQFYELSSLSQIQSA